MPPDEPIDAAAWPSTATSGVGRPHGTSRTAAFDRWFRYPAGFASDYVGMLLDQLGLDEGTVTDCFTGSGVTGTAARARGLNFTGIEAHPLIAELAALKLQSPAPPPEDITAAGTQLVDQVRTTLRNTTERDITGETDLVTRSFTPAALLTLLELRDALQQGSIDETSPYLKWALLGTLRDVAAVKVGWPYQRPGVAKTPRFQDVLERFEERLGFMVDDLTERSDPAGTSTVVCGDSRSKAAWQLLPGSAQACVSSPPYLNNFDYADATRLELYFWGEVRTWREMCVEVRNDMITATTQQSSKFAKAAAIEELRADTGKTAKKVIALTESLAAIRSGRPGRPKEYDQVVPTYFLAMRTILTNLHGYLDSGSPALWLVGDSAPYGVHIDTPALIGQLAAEIGFEVKEDIMLRRRGQRWSTNSSRASADLSERALVLRRP